MACAEAVSFAKGLGLPIDGFFLIVPEKPRVLIGSDRLVPDKLELLVFPNKEFIVPASFNFEEVFVPLLCSSELPSSSSCTATLLPSFSSSGTESF